MKALYYLLAICLSIFVMSFSAWLWWRIISAAFRCG
jgi:hypothetical protein